MKYSIDEWLEYKEMMVRIASDYKRKYPMVELDDLQQEMYLWFVSHPKKFKEWSTHEPKDRDKLIAKSLRNQCLMYCEKEKARKGGYDITDVYYYNAAVVEVFLPTIIAESYEMPSKLKDLGSQTKSSEINDGMNWLGLRSDIARGYYRLSEAKQNILRLRFSDPDAPWARVAEELDTTLDGARMKVQRAMTSSIQSIGGWRPYHDKDTTEQSTETTVDDIEE
jgi:hypothetical protein